MKTTRLFIYSAIFLLFTGMSALNAQPRMGMGMGKGMGNGMGPCMGPQNGCMAIPNLTDDQKAKIQELHIAHLKEMQPLKNQMNELKARQKTLTTADKPDMKAIDANIDEITKLQNTMMKKAADHQQSIRNILTDEQKLWFDAHMGVRKGPGHMKGNFRPNCPRYGMGAQKPVKGNNL